jgi:DNA-binding MltR family transcriptional regulator
MDNAFFNVQAVRAEFATASDRAAAIVGGAFLDVLLTELLQANFVPDPKNDDKIFQGNGCLATFSSRIDLSYRLGLIAKQEHRALHTIREIRNKFAHQLDAVAFARQDLRSLCANIEVPHVMVAPRSIPLSEKGEVPPVPSIDKADSNNPRAVFEESVETYMSILAARMAGALMSRRELPNQFSAAVEIARHMLAALEQNLAKIDALTEELNSMSAADVEGPPNREKYEMIAKVLRFSIQQMDTAHAQGALGPVSPDGPSTTRAT